MSDRENWAMSERLIFTLMAIWVARVTGNCGEPPQLENGSPTKKFTSGTLFDVGTKITYKCYLGYTFSRGTLNDSRSVTCREDSTWTPLQTICEPKTCGNPGKIVDGYYEAPNATFGSKVTFYCNRGYNMVGRNFRMCEADGWDGQVPTCEVVTCDDLPTIKNGTTPSPPYGDHWEYGMIATYSCNNDNSLIGAEKLTCTETSKWDNDPPTCKVVECQRPELPANSKTEEGFASTYKYGETISYDCNEGYEIVGKSVIECKENNTFVPVPPTCKPKDCGNPGEVLNGYYEAPSTTFGTYAIFYCNPGYRMLGKNYQLCKVDGWDGQGPACEVVTCHRPEVPVNGQIKSGFGPTYKYNEKISYICNAGFELVGKSVIVCEENNTFVPEPPTCRTKIPQARKIGEKKKKTLSANAADESGLGTAGIVISCIIGIGVGIAAAVGLSFYKKKRQRNLCKKVHINPQPNENQEEANLNVYQDQPA